MVTKLKILIITAWYPHDENPTDGIFVQNQAKASSLNNDVVLIHAKATNQKLRSLYTTTSENTDSFKVIKIKYKKIINSAIAYPINVIATFHTVNKLITQGWRPDIIHCHTFLPGIPALLLKIAKKIPYIITEHNSAFINNKLSFIQSTLAKIVMNNANYVVAVSNLLKQGINKYGITNVIKVIPNPINTRIFYPDQEKPNTTTYTFITVANLVKDKGIDVLLKALSKLKNNHYNYKLHIIGDGPEKSNLITLSRRLNVEKQIIFHDRQSQQFIAQSMRSSHLFILPSKYETFGIVFIEALACGTPVIGTLIPTLQEKISNQNGLLVPYGNAEKLSRAIIEILTHIKTYKSQLVAKPIISKYSLSSVGKLLDNLYRELIS